MLEATRVSVNSPPVTATPNGWGTSGLELNWLYGARLKGAYDWKEGAVGPAVDAREDCAQTQERNRSIFTLPSVLQIHVNV